MSFSSLIVCWLALGVVSPSSLEYQTHSRWESSIHLGVGAVEQQRAMVVQPRLSMEGSWGQFQLALPLWFQLGGDAGLGQGAFTEVNRWEMLRTYTGMIEYLSVTGKHGGWEVRVGTLRQETFGTGALINSYSTAWHPLHPNTGIVSEFYLDGLDFKLMVNE